MKALILAGGKGTRLKPLTNTTGKSLLPVAGRPILFYALEQVVEAGIKDIGIIISPDTGNWIKEAVGDGTKWGSKITYILQQEPLGLAHAVLTAHKFLKDDSFLMFLGDNLIKGGVCQFVSEFNKLKPDAMVLLKEVADSRLFGVAELDKAGHVVHLEEKPKEPKSNYALVGIYLFSTKIHDAIKQINPSKRGELEITDAIQKLIDLNYSVHSHILDGWWLDTGKKDDLLEANRVVLDEFMKRNVMGKVDSTSKIVGRVEIEEDTIIVNSTVRGPVFIGRGCNIKNSIIGPFCCIGQDSVIEESAIDHTVILAGCHIQRIERLQDSLIGKSVKLISGNQNFRALKLFVGDDASIEL